MPRGVIIIIFIPDPLGYVSLEPINTSNFLSSIHNIFRRLYFQANRVHTVKLAFGKMHWIPYTIKKVPVKVLSHQTVLTSFKLQNKIPLLAYPFIMKIQSISFIYLYYSNKALSILSSFSRLCKRVYTMQHLYLFIFYSFKGKQHSKFRY